MKSFDEFFKENFEDGLSDPSKYILKFTFEAGQQSKQAEVDGQFIANCKQTDHIHKLQREKDELRKRIDEAIYDLQHIESAMWEEQVEHVLVILKGDQS